MNSDQRPILVTGGAGFIGSHLVERLLLDGRSVVVLDDLSTGRIENLAAVKDHARIEIHVCAVSSFPKLEEMVGGCESVYHLAAAVGVDLVVKSPIRTIQTNLKETEAVLEAADRNRVPVLLTSTSEVYGKSGREVFEETDDLLIGPPTLGRWSYACSKLMDEFLAMAYWRERGLPVSIARLFNTVGPRQVGHYGMVVPRFVAAACAGEPLRVFGSGHQSRCFCHVADVVEALIRLQACEGARGEVFNIGSTEEITINELARLVVEVSGSASIIEHVPYDRAYAPGFEDMPRRRPSVDKLERWIGFRPLTPVREVLQLLTAGYKSKEASGNRMPL